MIVVRSPTRVSANGSAGCEQTAAVGFENSACQAPRHEGTGIDVDPVGADLRLPHRRMPMDDDFSKINVARQKFVADPQQVVRALLGKWRARAHAGVAQKVPADRQRHSELVKKLDVVLWKQGTEGLRGFFVALSTHHCRHIDPIGVQRLKTANVAPNPSYRGIGDEFLQHRFMVALESHESGRERVSCQAFDDLPRVRPTIDVVAERDGEAIVRRRNLNIARDECNHPLQQISTTVNVADYVKPLWHASCHLLQGPWRQGLREAKKKPRVSSVISMKLRP